MFPRAHIWIQELSSAAQSREGNMASAHLGATKAWAAAAQEAAMIAVFMVCVVGGRLKRWKLDAGCG